MRELGNVEQIRRSACEKLSGADLIVKAERKRLDMGKDIAPHIGFDPDAEKMSPVVDDIKHDRTKDVRDEDRNDQNGEQKNEPAVAGLLDIGEYFFQKKIREERKRDINACDKRRTADIEEKQFVMRAIIPCKSFDLVHTIILHESSRFVHIGEKRICRNAYA